MKRSYSKTLLHFCFFLVILTFLHPDHAVYAANSDANRPCNGSIAECDEDLETLMDSEINRRFLEGKRYISVGALKRDHPVCNSGASGEAYTKSGGCTPPQSNPYTRGCSKYYRCDRGD